MFSVSISEAKYIIRSINNGFGVNLSGRAMTSLRLRLSEIMVEQNLDSIEALLSRLSDNRNYFEIFLRDLSVGSPDMFRDPDFWKHAREHLIPEILESELYPEFIVPECVTGNELFSLKVALMEMEMDYRVDITAICSSRMLEKQVKEAYLPQAIYKNSRDNYETYRPGSELEQFTESLNGKRYLKKDILNNIRFRVQDPLQPYCSEKTRLVLYRNRMIFQNTEMQYSMLRKMLSDMRVGTYFVTGTRESIDGFGLEDLFETIDSDLKIYRRKHAD